MQDKKVDTEWLVEYNGDNKLLGFYKKIENLRLEIQSYIKSFIISQKTGSLHITFYQFPHFFGLAFHHAFYFAYFSFCVLTLCV